MSRQGSIFLYIHMCVCLYIRTHYVYMPFPSPGTPVYSPLQYSCLENPMDIGASWATVYGVAKSWTQLSDLAHIYCCYSVAQLCLTLCDPMDCTTPGFPVHHQLPELTQTHVHRVGDAIQPSHPLLSPSPPAFDLSQHQGLFSSGACSEAV